MSTETDTIDVAAPIERHLRAAERRFDKRIEQLLTAEQRTDMRRRQSPGYAWGILLGAVEEFVETFNAAFALGRTEGRAIANERAS